MGKPCSCTQFIKSHIEIEGSYDKIIITIVLSMSV